MVCFGKETMELRRESLNTFCVFWDFETGGWSTEGVATTQRNENFIQCSSSHLTSFAVLVGSESGSENEEEALSYISYIGCGISITCLILTITTILLLKNKVFDGIQDFVHFNLSLSLTLGLITFVSGIEAANNTDVGCAIVAVILHYTFLAAFCWMLCEGAFLLTRFYLVLYEGFFLNWKFYTALGWGLPVPVVAISFGAAHRYYGSDQTCWLSEDDGTI
ncbi:putative adhesion G protein-coupled receptor E4P [Dysidea avara]|uniref:putative adhesion G protein-coupled receptor E4P n=1 Tax=Dysidea avara TaxID=196820 RepID=UPI00332756C7